jgi:cytosine/adenosine deaminase-related metal-dependent hydrolase
MRTLLTAAWVAPMTAPLIRDGGVVFDADRIIQWGDGKSLAAAHPDATRIDLGAAVVLPGLVNAHTHLELSSCAAGNSPTSFVDWILSMPRRIGREPNQRADELFAASTRLGIEQCLRSGVTCVGDISQQMHVTRPILRDSPLRAVSYGEVIGLGKRRGRFEELLPMASDTSSRSDRLRIGLTPHSLYTVQPDDLRRCVRVAHKLDLPLAMHLAETPDEGEFIRSHSGPLKEMWERLGSWEDFPGTFDGSPVAFAKSIGLLRRPTLLAHVNYCDDDDLVLLARGKASVVYCPRTHRYFGHPPHRWREMLTRGGINVAVGTDSCASSPDLDLVEELRLLHDIAPDVQAEDLWRMATVNAARAIGQPYLYQSADFVVFDVLTTKPLTELLETYRLPREVWIAGRRVTASTPPASPC